MFDCQYGAVFLFQRCEGDKVPAEEETSGRILVSRYH